MKTIPDVRPSPIAGRWYSVNPHALKESIDGYLKATTLPQITGSVVGLVVPHAGHPYSGPVAAYAFKAVSGLKVLLPVFRGRMISNGVIKFILIPR